MPYLYSVIQCLEYIIVLWVTLVRGKRQPPIEFCPLPGHLAQPSQPDLIPESLFRDPAILPASGLSLPVFLPGGVSSSVWRYPEVWVLFTGFCLRPEAGPSLGGPLPDSAEPSFPAPVWMSLGWVWGSRYPKRCLSLEQSETW